MLILGGDASAKAQLRLALHLLARHLRVNGVEELNQHLDAIFSDLNRQEPTRLGEDEEDSEDAAMMMTPLLYDIHDVAARLRCSPRTVERLIRAGEIDSVRLGRSRRVVPDSLEAYVRTLSKRDERRSV